MVRTCGLSASFDNIGFQVVVPEGAKQEIVERSELHED